MSKITVFNNLLCKITKFLGANIFCFKFLEEVVILKEADTSEKPRKKLCTKGNFERKLRTASTSNDVIVYTA